MSMIAAADLGIVLLQQHMDRYKVVRCEIMCARRLAASARFFYSSIYREIDCCKEGRTVGIHHFSNDASGAAHKAQKVSTCIMDSTFWISGVTNADCVSDLPSMRRCTDVLPVAGGTAADTLAQISAHLQSINAPTWRVQPKSKQHFELFLVTSDRGSDQTAARAIFGYDIRSTQVALLSVDCLDHATQCVERGGLKLIDLKLKELFPDTDWSYYTSCVKLGHNWRRHHCGMRSFILLNYDETVSQAAKYLCSVCDVGRWGAILFCFRND